MYRIVGIDGKIYGPATAGQIRRWLAENRVESRTPVFVDGAAEWTFLGLLPEFANCFPMTPPVDAPSIRFRRSNFFATAGLVNGIAAWALFCCCFGFPFNLFGLVLSLIGLSQINSDPERYEGRGQAIAGLVLSILSLLILLLCLVWSVATGNFEVNGVKF
jgi:hypothetical protein